MEEEKQGKSEPGKVITVKPAEQPKDASRSKPAAAVSADDYKPRSEGAKAAGSTTDRKPSSTAKKPKKAAKKPAQKKAKPADRSKAKAPAKKAAKPAKAAATAKGETATAAKARSESKKTRRKSRVKAQVCAHAAEAYGLRIRAEMDEKGVKMSELAKSIGVSYERVRRAVSGSGVGDVSLYLEIMSFFGLIDTSSGMMLVGQEIDACSKTDWESLRETARKHGYLGRLVSVGIGALQRWEGDNV